ncbi:hypothetical protein PLESTM_001132300 [Pleodorina starrii]|nr:hypothetical protein PLESTM_001132300 [Pleodorina starrii]
MWLLLAGAAIGIGGAITWIKDRRRKQSPHDDVEASEPLPSSDVEPENPITTSCGRSRRACLVTISTVSAAAVVLGSLMVVTGASLLAAKRRGSRPGRQRSARGGPPRIPLKELVRFREEQWFLEELENSRDGDPNAMLRLAKMYLYGQGCERSVNIAQEWLRRARAGGIYCTLDELLTAEDLEAIRRQSRTNAERQLERRQHHIQYPSHYNPSTA